jgi:hypothetical protein
MGRYTRLNLSLFTACLTLLSAQLVSSGQVFVSDGQSDAVQVQFSDGPTELATLDKGVEYYANESWKVSSFPAEISGLTFTRRNTSPSGSVTLDIPANTTVYLALGHFSAAKKARQAAEALGWRKFAELHFEDESSPYNLVYKYTSLSALHCTISVSGGVGVIVVARHMVLNDAPQSPAQQAPSDSNEPKPEIVKSPLHPDMSVRAVRIARFQNSIKSLYVIVQDNTSMLGGASDLIVTAEPGLAREGDIPISYATPVGHDMATVLDELVRRMQVIYPNITGCTKIEFSFEDKYIGHDGGSIGAACGTLLLSLFQGFEIDPKVAMTGDISADGKIRAIGGIAAKLRGATEAGCTVAAVPMENQDQLVDALISQGSPLLTGIQVIGMSTLDDGAAIARADRDPKLTQAIALFAQIQQSLKDFPDYLTKPQGVEKLKKVLELAPNHLSAQLLLSSADNKLRHRLSAWASEYYTFAAVRGMLPTLYAREGHAPQSSDIVSSVYVEEGVKNLHHLRPMADLSVQPLIDAWIDFSTTLDETRGWNTYVEAKAEAVRDAMAKLNADQDLAQKMLKQGV